MPLASNTNLKDNIEQKIEKLYQQDEIDYFSNISETNDGFLTHKIHTEISWYDNDQLRLKIRPDITLLKPENLKITSGFDRPLPRKGLHSNDGGIIFEIKYDREKYTISEDTINGIFKDIRNFKYIYNRFLNQGLEDEIYGYFIFFIKSN